LQIEFMRLILILGHNVNNNENVTERVIYKNHRADIDMTSTK